MTGAEGVRLKEGGNINRSLVCLGTVISALGEEAPGNRSRTKFRNFYLFKRSGPVRQAWWRWEQEGVHPLPRLRADLASEGQLGRKLKDHHGGK